MLLPLGDILKSDEAGNGRLPYSVVITGLLTYMIQFPATLLIYQVPLTHRNDDKTWSHFSTSRYRIELSEFVMAN